MRCVRIFVCRHAAAAAASIAVITSTGFAQTLPPIPIIYTAAADAEQTTLIVQGKHFAQDAAAYLGGVPIGGVSVNAAGTVLMATITGTLPGSYQLRISNGRFLTQNAFFDVTLGAVGPPGPPGVPGPPGPDQSGAIAALTARIEALETLLANFHRMGDDVMIKANAIRLVAATSVAVDAGTSVHLDGVSTVNIQSQGSMDLEAAGVMTIKGALVKIN